MLIALLFLAFIIAAALVVPRAIDQVQEALGGRNLEEEAAAASGWKREVLVEVQDWLEDLPSARELVDPALEATGC